jgi:hypothetical protein
MIRLQRMIALFLLLQLFVATGAFAQNQYSGNDRAWAVRGGIGFTDGPDSFLMNFDFETMAREQVAVGLGMQLGVEDDFVIVSPMIYARYIFDMSGFTNEVAKELRPFLQGGTGLTHISVDNRGGDDDGTGFLLSIGGGVDYPLDDSISIGSRMLINVIPGEALNQRVYFSWELISVRYNW